MLTTANHPRQDAIAVLTATVANGGEGVNNSEAADVLGIDKETVRRDRVAIRLPGDPGGENAPESPTENGHVGENAPTSKPAAPRKRTITLYTHKS